MTQSFAFTHPCREISEDKIAVCEITADLGSGNISYFSVFESVSSRKNISVPRHGK